MARHVPAPVNSGTGQGAIERDAISVAFDIGGCAVDVEDQRGSML